MGPEHSTYTKLKQLFGQMISSTIAILHFDGSFNVDLMEFQTILAHYSNMHFPTGTYSPVCLS